MAEDGWRRIVPGPEIVGVWPAAVWIVVGTLVWLGDPDHFAGWKGGVYYVLGTGIVALVGGMLGQSARRAVGDIQERLLKEVRHRWDFAAWGVAVAMRLLVMLVEAVAVTLLSLTAVGILW